VTFESGDAAIGRRANLTVAPSGQGATVACSASFSASNVQPTAVFISTTGSILDGLSSSAGTLTVGRDSSSTSLDASTAVTVGSSTTYTTTVGLPAARPGSLEPTGSVEFLDDGQPIGSCTSLSLSNGEATRAVTYGPQPRMTSAPSTPAIATSLDRARRRIRSVRHRLRRSCWARSPRRCSGRSLTPPVTRSFGPLSSPVCREAQLCS